MKILFLISSNGKGAGGHYNSLVQISSEIAKRHSVKLILLGKGDSPIIKSSPNFEQHIKYGKSIRDLILLNRELKSIFERFNPDVIHCFDTDSLNKILILRFFKLSIPIVWNKCGGKNPLHTNHQHADAIVVFSKENQDWYIQNKNYNDKEIFLISNRVKSLERLPFEKQKEKASEDKLTFLRISRLGGAYDFTLNQTFNLLDKLSETLPIEFYLVGTIQDQDIFQKIVDTAMTKSYVVNIITDERAYRGSDFLYLADFVIGTGRSFMEATSLGIPTLTPAKNSNIPILVDKSNVEVFLSTNFSERNVAQQDSEFQTLQNIDNAYNNKSYKAALTKDSIDLFDEYFGTSVILAKYEKVYKFVLDKDSSLTNLVRKNLPYLFKFFYK
jgi:hypothetical protein